jgi:hypothetical protein
MDGTPVAYDGLAKGTPVLTRDGHPIGTLEHVLSIPEEDLFDGIVVATDHGIRFVDRDQILALYQERVVCDLDDAAAAALPEPEGPPVYTVDALQDVGPNLTDWLGRVFRRAHWVERKPHD